MNIQNRTHALFGSGGFLGRDAFCLKRARQAEAHLLEIAASPKEGVRITAESLRQRSLTLGDFIVSSSPRFYVTDDQNILGRCQLPYTDNLAWFEGVDGLAHQLCQVLRLARLQHIAQLSLLGYPVGQGLSQFSQGFNHSRLLHTYDVYVIGMLCAHNAFVFGTDALALRVSLLIHDLFTPACGDLMKFVDRERYDEDELLTELLSQPQWIELCQNLKLDPKEPIRIAQEKDGLLCSLRDFADTLAYVSRDLHMFQGSFKGMLSSWYEDKEDQLLEAKLREIESGQTPFDLWQHVHRGENGRIVIDDTDKLRKFLFARACLFRLLYYHRQTRHVEYIIGIRLVKILLERGVLKEGDFFGPYGSDSRVWMKVHDETGYNPDFLHEGTRGDTEVFETFEGAQEAIKGTVETDPDVFGLIYKWPSNTKSKVGSWSVYKDDHEVPFDKACPKEAREIEDVMRLPHGYFGARVYRRSVSMMKIEYWDLLRKMSLDVV